MPVELNTKYLETFINTQEYYSIKPHVELVHNLLHNKTGLGSENTGWLTLPTDFDKEEFGRIKEVAQEINLKADVFLVIGIGGSYLGARAVIELIKSQNYNALSKNTPDIYFVGNNISASTLNDVLRICEGKDVCVNVISKSGTTMEPAIAFRIFRKFLEDKYGKDEAKKRIFCTTDRKKGTLKQIADQEGYEIFTIPNDVGGRYSVLTSVGLLPIAVAGINIDALMLGAKCAQDKFNCSDLEKNDCYKYAAIRNLLYQKGKNIEILVNYEPNFTMLNEWFKQLFGESEGKCHKGIFPASAIFSTDLHSMGQYIQDGMRNLFETVVYVEEPSSDVLIEALDDNSDGLNFLAGKSISFVNENAFLGTLFAHTDGGVPNIILELPQINPFEVGYLIYFFEKACAVSSYIMGVNPFNQPGVEEYKKNMFALLGKPGYETCREVLFERFK